MKAKKRKVSIVNYWSFAIPTMEVHPGVLYVYPGAIRTHSEALEAHPGAIEAQPGTVEVYHKPWKIYKLIYTPISDGWTSSSISDFVKNNL